MVRPFAGSDYNRLAESGQALRSFVVAGAPSSDGVPAFFYEGGAWWGVVPPYKDYIAQSITDAEGKREQAFGHSYVKCGKYFSWAEDVLGVHYFGKRHLDYQEWCPACGKDWSAAHRRRALRWIPKVQQFLTGLYIVVELPLVNRAEMRTQQALRAFEDLVMSVIAGRHGRHGRVGGICKRGVSRWHWFNDERPGYRADVYNPHLNFLLDRGRLSKAELEELKGRLRAVTDCPKLIVHASYGTGAGWLMHKTKYITRATFLNRDWSNALADELRYFRNGRFFGKWVGVPLWELSQAESEGEDISGLEAVKKLSSGICCDCGVPLKVRGFKRKVDKKSGEVVEVLDKVSGLPIPVYWSEALPSVLLDASGAVEISGTGYYRIPAGWVRENDVVGERGEIWKVRGENEVLLKRIKDDLVRKRRLENLERYKAQVAAKGWRDGVH